MQYSTESLLSPNALECALSTGLEGWSNLVRSLSKDVDLEASAQSSGALVRRRQVKSASDLLRLVLGYAVCDWSLRLLGMWCVLWGVGSLSRNALRKRLRHCRQWLGQLIVAVLVGRSVRLPAKAGLRLRLQDATVVSRGGSQGTEWRIHLSLDLERGSLAGVEVTDAHGAETLARFAVQPGEIRIADRGYAYSRGLWAVLADGGQIVVRINWQNLPLEDENGTRLAVADWLREVDKAGLPVQEKAVWLSTPQGRFPLRLVACALPPDKVAAARRRAQQAARKKKHTLDARTLLAAGFVILVTNLPATDWSAREVVELYRFRWQVEMYIKRLKSLLVLDGLRAQDPELAQTYLLGKLLGVLLLEEMNGYMVSVPLSATSANRPISLWRMMALCQEVLKGLIRGAVSLSMLYRVWPYLGRFLADDPRKRPSQWAAAQAVLHTKVGY